MRRMLRTRGCRMGRRPLPCRFSAERRARAGGCATGVQCEEPRRSRCPAAACAGGQRLAGGRFPGPAGSSRRRDSIATTGARKEGTAPRLLPAHRRILLLDLQVAAAPSSTALGASSAVTSRKSRDADATFFWPGNPFCAVMRLTARWADGGRHLLAGARHDRCISGTGAEYFFACRRGKTTGCTAPARDLRLSRCLAKPRSWDWSSTSRVA